MMPCVPAAVAAARAALVGRPVRGPSGRTGARGWWGIRVAGDVEHGSLQLGCQVPARVRQAGPAPLGGRSGRGWRQLRGGTDFSGVIGVILICLVNGFVG